MSCFYGSNPRDFIHEPTTCTHEGCNKIFPNYKEAMEHRISEHPDCKNCQMITRRYKELKARGVNFV